MSLTQDEVAGIASYARIALTPDELAEMTSYLNDAISLLDPILAYDLVDVEPTSHPMGDLSNVMRDDVPVVGLSLKEALANASSSEGRAYKVPALLAGGGAA